MARRPGLAPPFHAGSSTESDDDDVSERSGCADDAEEEQQQAEALDDSGNRFRCRRGAAVGVTHAPPYGSI